MNVVLLVLFVYGKTRTICFSAITLIQTIYIKNLIYAKGTLEDITWGNPWQNCCDCLWGYEKQYNIW